VPEAATDKENPHVLIAMGLDHLKSGFLMDYRIALVQHVLLLEVLT